MTYQSLISLFSFIYGFERFYEFGFPPSVFPFIWPPFDIFPPLDFASIFYFIGRFPSFGFIPFFSFIFYCYAKGIFYWGFEICSPLWISLEHYFSWHFYSLHSPLFYWALDSIFFDYPAFWIFGSILLNKLLLKYKEFEVCTIKSRIKKLL